MLFMVQLLFLINLSIHLNYVSCQWPYGRSSFGGNGMGSASVFDGINAGLTGNGDTIVSREVKDDGTNINTYGWNNGLGANAGFAKGIGGNYGGYGQGGPYIVSGQGQGNGWLDGGVNAGVGSNGGTTIITNSGQDGSYVYGVNNNVGVGGNLGAGLNGGGMGSGQILGPCGYGGCGNGGVRGFGGAGVFGGLNANNGYMIEKTVLPNGGYVKKTSGQFGLGGNLGVKGTLGGDGGGRLRFIRPQGRSLGGSYGSYEQSPMYEQAPMYVMRQRRRPQKQHPYFRTLEGMYSREMEPSNSIIMIDDPVVILMPEDAPAGGGGGSTTPASSSTPAASSTPGASSTPAASSTEAATTTEPSTTTAAE